DRLVPFAAELRQRHAGDTVLVVGHRGSNRVLWGLLLGHTLQESLSVRQKNDTLLELRPGGTPEWAERRYPRRSAPLESRGGIMRSVVVEMKEVRLRLRSEYGELVDYVGLHLPDRTGAAGDPQITVDVLWFEGGATDVLDFPGQDRLDRVGKRLLAGPGELVWT